MTSGERLQKIANTAIASKRTKAFADILKAWKVFENMFWKWRLLGDEQGSGEK